MIGTGALIAFAALNREFVATTIDLLLAADGGFLAVGFSLYAASLIASAIRVRLLLRSFGHSASHWRLIADAARAVGLSALLAIGAGDLYRVGRLRTMGVPLTSAGLVVGIDRAVGTIAVVAAGIGFLVTSGRDLVGFHLALPIGWGGVALGLTAGWWITRRLLPQSWRMRAPILEDHWRSSAVLLTSLAVILLWLGSVVSIARSIDIRVDAGVLAFSASWVTLATLLPLSIGGVGVREAGYAVLLSAYHVSTTQAVSLGILQYTSMLVLSAVAWIAPSGGSNLPEDAASESRSAR